MNAWNYSTTVRMRHPVRLRALLVAGLLACTLPAAASATCRDVRTPAPTRVRGEEVAAAMG
jgi:hypothetical protein